MQLFFFLQRGIPEVSENSVQFKTNGPRQVSRRPRVALQWRRGGARCVEPDHSELHRECVSGKRRRAHDGNRGTECRRLRHTDPGTSEYMTVGEVNSQVYAALMGLSSEAFDMVLSAGSGAGLEAWRRLLSLLRLWQEDPEVCRASL